MRLAEVVRQALDVPVDRVDVVGVPARVADVVRLGGPRSLPLTERVALEELDLAVHAQVLLPHLLRDLGLGLGVGRDRELPEAVATREAGVGQELLGLRDAALQGVRRVVARDVRRDQDVRRRGSAIAQRLGEGRPIDGQAEGLSNPLVRPSLIGVVELHPLRPGDLHQPELGAQRRVGLDARDVLGADALLRDKVDLVVLVRVEAREVAEGADLHLDPVDVGSGPAVVRVALHDQFLVVLPGHELVRPVADIGRIGDPVLAAGLDDVLRHGREVRQGHDRAELEGGRLGLDLERQVVHRADAEVGGIRDLAGLELRRVLDRVEEERAVRARLGIDHPLPRELVIVGRHRLAVGPLVVRVELDCERVPVGPDVDALGPEELLLAVREDAEHGLEHLRDGVDGVVSGNVRVDARGLADHRSENLRGRGLRRRRSGRRGARLTGCLAWRSLARTDDEDRRDHQHQATIERSHVRLLHRAWLAGRPIHG